MQEDKRVFTSIKEVPETTWKKLSEKRIYFGHQSVGSNLIDGMKDLMKENPQIKLNIVETNAPAALSSPVFAHSSLGRNMEPKSKCDAFADSMEKGLGGKVDIAFFKLCFVDVSAKTDVDSLFSEYKQTVTQLKAKYPKTTFMHMTVPLTTVQTGVKAWVKGIVGRTIGGYDDNARREEFNGKLRSEYEGKVPLLDLARIESTAPDGTRFAFKNDGKTFYGLSPAYTNDGGHLNEKGRKLAAEQLLVLLATLSQ